jgi:hypothetical protein
MRRRGIPNIRHAGSVAPIPEGGLRATIWTVLAVVALLACYVGLGLSASCRKSQTGDEGAHMAGGVSYWAFNDYRIQPNNGNWPQRLCGLPLWLSGYRFPSIDTPEWRALQQWAVGDQFLYESGNDADAMLLRGRTVTALLGVALGLLIFGWSRRLFGGLGGLLSLAIFAFSPAMFAHGFLITSDVASALCFTAAVGALWLVLHRISPGTLLLAWLAISGLFLSKFSSPILLPMGFALAVVRLINPAPVALAFGRPRTIRGQLRQVTAFTAVATLLVLGVALSIWASFGFRYSLFNPAIAQPDEHIPWNEVEANSRAFSAAVAFARDYHLLPEAYVYGFAHAMRSSQGWNAFLNGELRRFGWLGYFPYCLATKTPLEFFVLFAAAVAAMWRYGRSSASQQESDTANRLPAGWHLPYELMPMVVLFAVYWVFALTSHLNIGERHLLPSYPPLFILAGAAVWWFQPPTNRRTVPGRPARGVRRSARTTTMRVVVVVALLLFAAEGIWYWPHYLAYFNILAGGPRHAYRHLVDSSLDWSQDLKGLKRWLDEHPADASDTQRLYFSFFGSAPPEYYGIHVTRLPSHPPTHGSTPYRPLTGGTYLISATMLQCVALPYSGRWNRSYERQYQQARENVAGFLARSGTAEGRQQLLAETPKETWNVIFWVYEALRFSRLASFLRQREPDDEIGYSILVYRLTDADVAQSLDGPPAELLARPEIDSENIRLGLAAPGEH